LAVGAFSGAIRTGVPAKPRSFQRTYRRKLQLA